jgi:hypothetical protein
VNRGELSVNVVRIDKAKDADRLEPKGTWASSGTLLETDSRGSLSASQKMVEMQGCSVLKK